jgi:hypothetical protein
VELQSISRCGLAITLQTNKNRGEDTFRLFSSFPISECFDISALCAELSALCRARIGRSQRRIKAIKQIAFGEAEGGLVWVISLTGTHNCG